MTAKVIPIRRARRAPHTTREKAVPVVTWQCACGSAEVSCAWPVKKAPPLAPPPALVSSLISCRTCKARVDTFKLVAVS